MCTIVTCEIMNVYIYIVCAISNFFLGKAKLWVTSPTERVVAYLIFLLFLQLVKDYAYIRLD